MKKINYARDLLEGPWDDVGEFLAIISNKPQSYASLKLPPTKSLTGVALLKKITTQSINRSTIIIYLRRGLGGDMCHIAESCIVIETVGPENGYKRDNYSPHLVTNQLSTANKHVLESELKCQNVS